MKLIHATEGHAALIGKIHSIAWQQAYEGLFPADYINTETSDKRKREFAETLPDERYQYFLIFEEDACVGVVKIVTENKECEIASIYILKKYCGRGFGQEVMSQLVEMYKDYRIFLWTLEENDRARNFYEKTGFKVTGDVRTISRGRDYKQVKYEF